MEFKKTQKLKNFIFKSDYNFYSILILCINFVIGVVGILFKFALANYLQNEQYATFSSILVILNIYLTIFLPIQYFLINVISKLAKKKDTIFTFIKVIKLYFFYTTIFSALILINIEHISNYLEIKKSTFYFIFIYLVISPLHFFFMVLFQAIKNFKIFNIIYFVTHISKYLVTIIALFQFQTLFSVFVSFTISSIFTLFVSIIYFLLYFKDEFIYSLSKKIKNNLKFNETKILKTSSITIICFVYLTQIDMVIVNKNLNDNIAANYALAFTFAKILHYFFIALSNIAYPIFVQNNLKKENSINNIIFTAIMILIISSIYLSAIYFFVDDLIYFLYGDRYKLAEEITFLLVLCTLPHAFIFFFENYLLSSNRIYFSLIIVSIIPIQLYFYLNNVGNIEKFILINGFFSYAIFCIGAAWMLKKLN